MATIYKLTRKPYTFYANVSHAYETDDVYINIGGSKRCISIVVYTENNEAVLQTLEFHDSCDTKKKLKRGTEPFI